MHIGGDFYALSSPEATTLHVHHLRLHRTPTPSMAHVKARGSLPPRAVQVVAVHNDGHGPVVDQLDLHVGSEDTGFHGHAGFA